MSTTFCTSEDEESDEIKLTELKTERSTKLSEMMIYFRQQREFFPEEELASVGVTVINLPGVDSLVSDEGSFRPHPPFTLDIPSPPIEEGSDGAKPLDELDIPAALEEACREIYPKERESKGFDPMDSLFPWTQDLTYVS